MLIIGLVALVVLGPDRLPEAARNLGKAIADIRRATEPARAAWTDMTAEITNVVNATGNPWTIHPVLEKMTLEERESYMHGGPMPERVALELDQMQREPLPGAVGAGSPYLDYPMPHQDTREATEAKEPSETETISYPSPSSTS